MGDVPADPTLPPGDPEGPTPAAGPPPAPRRAGGVRSVARRWAAAVWDPTPVSMRRIALAGVISSAVIIVTGAAVRLSKSGLGCPDWPQCTRGSLVAAPTRGDPMFHTWIEFGNRMVTVVVTVVAVAVLVAAWRFRPGGRRRRDLVWLAAAQPAGVVAQIVLGGIVVLTDLNPALVSLHFVVSVTAVMLAAGTVVTGTGPLAGAGAVPRYHLPLTGVTQFHSDIGWLLGGLAVALVVGLRLTRAPAQAMRLGWVLLALLGVQGVVGYTQYFTGLPAGLVWVHVTGSLLIWVAALRLMFAVRDRGPLVQPPPESPGGPAATARPEAQPAPAR